MWCALGVQNRLIGFPLFLMGKIKSTYEDFSLRTTPRDGLSSYLEVTLYVYTACCNLPSSTKCPTETECWVTEKCTKAQRFLTLGTDLAFSVIVIVASEFPSKNLPQLTSPQVIRIDVQQ